MSKKKLKIFFLAVVLFFFIIPPASAYLDPGFANMVWQMVAAVAFAIVFTLKMYWMKIKDFFSGKKNE
jgi:hypothetical protein